MSYWKGFNSLGEPVQLARRKDGVFFIREYRFNGYGKTWSRWEHFEDEVILNYVVKNYYDGSLSESENPRVEFGFNDLEYMGKGNFRLPKDNLEPNVVEVIKL